MIIQLPLLLDTPKIFWEEWRKIYRYHGGFPAYWRCWAGTRRLLQDQITPPGLGGPQRGEVDCITFSVIPKMTTLWFHYMQMLDREIPLRILSSDCSGALGSYLPFGAGIEVIPMLNYHHGVKLDLFLYRLCRAPYVVVTDDDIFWLSSEPLQWALDQLRQDPKMAVVSLLPKDETPDVLRGKVERPMGSCFVIRRDLWVQEKLSFQVDYSPWKEGFEWFYETGEKAQVELLKRGYHMTFAPEDVKRDLVDFKGISSWLLKIQKNAGDLSDYVRDPGRRKKGLQAILVAKGLAALFAARYPDAADPHLAPPDLLDRAEAICRERMTQAQVTEAETEIDSKLSRLAAKL